MRKVTVLLAAVLVLGSTAACPDPEKKCEPGSIREDSNRAGRYWVCAPDGSKENPVDGPTPKNPIDT